MLDIEALRLTHEERTEAFASKYGSVADIADAQLAKALWALRGWLDREADDMSQAHLLGQLDSEVEAAILHGGLGKVDDDGNTVPLEQANIERPSADTFYSSATVKGDSPDQWQTFRLVKGSSTRLEDKDGNVLEIIDGVRYLNGERVTDPHTP